MSLAERADLVARLSLDDKFSKPLTGAQKKLSGFGSSLGRLGKTAGIAIGAAVGVGAAFVTKNVESGLDSLAQLESAVGSVDGAIKQMGLTGKLTGSQVAQWANEIEASVGAAFDDKDITQAATTLLRFGKVTETNLRPALVVMTDLATKTGSVDSAATLLAKALADPTKAAGKLSRAGVVLTKAQQDQIKALVKAGKTGKAQTVILDALTKATKGAAEASQGPYVRSQKVLADVIEDAQRALATGFLPVLEEVRKELSDELAKPETLARIKEFGTGLAGGLKSVIGFVKTVPWNEVGAVLKGAADFGRNIAGAFLGLPPEAKGLILGLAGLNKLTGGGVIKVGVDLLQGAGGALFSQFLGKGSPANPMYVVPVGGGLGGGAPGVPTTGPSSGVSTLGKVFLVGEAIGLVAAVAAVGDAVKTGSLHQAEDVHTTLTAGLNQPNTQAELQTKLDAINTGIAKLKADPVAAALITGPTIAELEKMRADVVAAMKGELPAAIDKSPDARQERHKQNQTLYRMDTRLEAVKARAAQTTAAVERARIAQVAATRTGDSAIVAAIRGIPAPIVKLSVTSNTFIRAAQVSGTYTAAHVGAYNKAGSLI